MSTTRKPILQSSAKPLLIFSHGNSFPASTYSVLLNALRKRGYTVSALEKLGHDPRYPVTQNWPHLVAQLAEFIAAEPAEHALAHPGPLVLVGHSLGGFLSLMTACQHPVLGQRKVAGVLLLDSPLVGGWRAQALAIAQSTGVAGRFPPGAISRQRRNRWQSQEEALGHYSGKASFAKWHPQVLQDYITHGTHQEGGERVLTFTREVETAIYNTLPNNMAALLRQHPPQFPVAFIGGEQSQELKQAGLALTRQVVGERMNMLPGTHLFPMELPLETAAAVDTAIGGLIATQ